MTDYLKIILENRHLLNRVRELAHNEMVNTAIKKDENHDTHRARCWVKGVEQVVHYLKHKEKKDEN